MAVHPIFPDYVAIAIGDGSVQLLDRRKEGEVLSQPPLLLLLEAAFILDTIQRVLAENFERAPLSCLTLLPLNSCSVTVRTMSTYLRRDVDY